jgi:cobalt/nickel transport system permease protein
VSSRHRRGYLERTLDGLREAIVHALAAEGAAGRNGLLQRIDPRAKVAGLLALVFAAVLSTSAVAIAAVLALAVAAAALSRLSLGRLATGVWLPALVFTGAIALPALVLVPGREVARVPLAGWAVTAQGLSSAGYLLLRVETAATLAWLLVFTTPWTRVLKALRVLRVPVVVVVMLGMTYRYILLLLEIAHEMFVARRSRTIAPPSGRGRRQAVAASAGVLLTRSLQLSGEVYQAMQSRGFRGEVRVLDDFRMRGADWLALASFVAIAAAAAWVGR